MGIALRRSTAGERIGSAARGSDRKYASLSSGGLSHVSPMAREITYQRMVTEGLDFAIILYRKYRTNVKHVLENWRVRGQIE